MERTQVYRCEVCGNIVEVYHVGGGQLTCCDQPMTLQVESTADSSTEKHVPVIKPVEGGVRVEVGSVPHPMVDKHWIQWIEVISGDKVYREHLNPGDEPAAFFPLPAEGLVAREYCNLHGHWKA